MSSQGNSPNLSIYVADIPKHVARDDWCSVKAVEAAFMIFFLPDRGGTFMHLLVYFIFSSSPDFIKVGFF